MLTTTPLLTANSLRDSIINAYRMDEATCLKTLLTEATLSPEALTDITQTATQIVLATRERKKTQGKLDTLLHQYDLSTDEGIALMCLAEALLRIPDKATMDKFISDKISTVDWKNHLAEENAFFVNAATWSLLLTGKIYAPTLDQKKSLFSSLKKVVSRLGITMIRPIILQMMKALGNQFVMGETIQAALKRAQKPEAAGYQFSYDMLGEAARSAQDAETYFNAYRDALTAIGKSAKSENPIENPGISVKLSANQSITKDARF